MSDKPDKPKALAVIPTTTAITTTGPDLVEMIRFPSETGGEFVVYGIRTEGEPAPLVETKIWRLYVADLPSGQRGLMKVNRPDVEGSFEALEREVRMLHTLHQIAEEVDAEWTKNPNKPFHGANFPIVLETLQPEDNKLVVFLGYHDSIATYRQLTPLSLIAATERVDMQTGTWMLGKLLKTLVFAHDLGMTLGLTDTSNIFVETSVHGVLVFDLTNANDDASADEMKAEVSAAARIIWQVVGGDDSKEPPHDLAIMSEATHAEFVMHLKRMMDGKTDGSRAEHVMIYTDDTGLADRTWPKVPNADSSGMKRPWHEYCTYPRS